MSWVGSGSTHFTAALSTRHATRQVIRLREGLPPLTHSSLHYCIGLIWTLSTNFIGYCDVALHLFSFAGQSVLPVHILAVYIPQAKAWGFDGMALKSNSTGGLLNTKMSRPVNPLTNLETHHCSNKRSVTCCVLEQYRRSAVTRENDDIESSPITLVDGLDFKNSGT